MAARLSLWILTIFGWRVTGHYPHELPRVLMAAAPHTSNWDFPLGILARTAWNIQANFIGKHTLFIWPLSIFMRWQGGIPVDRRIKGNFVTQTVAAIKKAGRAHIVIAPEGTRSLTSSFKTGFYHIAKGADMPILLVTFDWGNKIVDFGELFHPTDNQEADLAYIWNYFKGVQGCIPEKGIF
jgi:1-acyl-sn-glycerol-3-phosphate acyltransferase